MQTCVCSQCWFLGLQHTLDKGDGWGLRQGGHCFVSHLSLIGFGSRNGDMSEVVLLTSFHPGSV